MYKVLMLLTTCLVPVILCLSEDEYQRYRFMFSTGDKGAHTRQEQSDGTGRVTGMYRYMDPNGILQTTRYVAAPDIGYHAYQDNTPQVAPISTPESQNMADFQLARIVEMLVEDATPVPSEATADLQSSGTDASTVESTTQDLASNGTEVSNANDTKPETEEISNSSVENSTYSAGAMPEKANTTDVTRSVATTTDGSDYPAPAYFNVYSLLPPYNYYPGSYKALPFVYAMPHRFYFQPYSLHYTQ